MGYVLDGLDVTSVRADDAGERWHDWCNSVHGELGVDYGDAGFRGTVTRQRAASFELVGWTSTAERVDRRRSSIRRDPRDHVKVLLPVKGVVDVGAGGVDRSLRPGEFVVVPPDQPFTVAHGDWAQAIALLLPTTRIRHLSLMMSPRPRVVDGVGMARVVHHLLVGLHAAREHLTETQFETTCDRATELLTLAAAGDEPEPQAAADAVFDAVARFVREHLADPDLGVAAVAHGVGWSRRYIQAALKRNGTTVTELIRIERLDRARAMLVDPAKRSLTISAIAARVGITSPSAFSSAFRARYGCSPRDVR
ncbi:helix-turn-helix transcriptional regulator [Gordonia shandongensis]|uniref:helix-turn-helix transcriptional regulator n=1 Tax=Gordonia shandongensis TaxID=376351 RepID=UPI00040E57F7|nr:AraC family transcriptional regulator [Gordonia shandongensis]